MAKMADKKLIIDLLKERAEYAKMFGIKEAHSVYNFLISYHIRGIKSGKPTLKSFSHD